MINRTEYYDKEAKTWEFKYYWYDRFLKKHEFDSCFDALEALEIEYEKVKGELE